MAFPTAFQNTAIPSQHANQVNYFQNINEVYQTYNQVAASHAHNYRLAVPTDYLNVTTNEVETILEYQEIINPLLRKLIANQGYQPKEEQFVKFTELLKSSNNTEQANTLRGLADKVANWKGFHWAASVQKLGLEFLTEWTHTTAGAIDNVHAFGYADFLVTNNLEDCRETWRQYLSEDTRAQKLQPFRQTLEEIVAPQHKETVDEEGVEGMSISTALQDFRRQTPLSVSDLFVETSKIDTLPSSPSNRLKLQEKAALQDFCHKMPVSMKGLSVESNQLETLLSSRLLAVKEKMAFIKEVMAKYPSIAAAYQTMKTPQFNIPEELVTANNYRRECGGTGFLIALQQAIKGKGVSKTFYLLHRDLINEIVTTCNEMDKNNFEILLNYGKYEKNAIPSPYAFFEQLDKLI
jgi:hypothetical protein